MSLPLPPAARAAMLRQWAARARLFGEDYIVRARAADDEAAAIEQAVRAEAAARREAATDTRQAKEWLGPRVTEVTHE